MKEFILQSLVYSGLLYLSYVLLFRRMSFFRINRMLLLAIPLLSLLIPLLASRFNSPLSADVLNFTLADIEIGPQPAPTAGRASQNINWLGVVYFSGAGLFSFLMLAGLLKAYRLLRAAQPWHHPILLSEKANAPFAFFGRIVIPLSLQQNRQLETIIRHEHTHVKQGHSYDNAFYGALCCLFWFNPFFHLLFKELRQVHECLADQNAMVESDRESYARLLLSSAMGCEITSLVASPFFNSSLIKTRITMLYQAKTKQKMKSLYLSLLPLILIMGIWSCQKSETVSKSPTEAKSEIIAFSQADQPPLFENCDENASKDEQMNCFKQGIMGHVMSNFKYPPLAREKGLEGKILVQFTIDRDGAVRDAEVVRWNFSNGQSKGTAAEGTESSENHSREKLEPAAREAIDKSIELVEALPQLSPALKGGKPAAVQFTLPLTLKL